MTRPLRISCEPDELDQGLFGNVLAHTVQILPYLFEQNLYPAWELRSKHYGDLPDQITIPGVVDLAYTPPPGPYRTLSLTEMRRRHGHILGGDWEALKRIWDAYFKIPSRVLAEADRVTPPGRVLGIHYRGTDKQSAAWDSNPISQDQFLVLIQDFLAQNESYDSIFVGTDEPSFLEKIGSSIPLPVLSLGAAEFHMATEHSTSRREKSDQAFLDCLVLSRCATLIQTSSALPSFTKLFSPELQVFRTAASKLFTNMPYFPVAYIPVLPVTTPAAKEILSQTMQQDWTTQQDMGRFLKPFASVPRWPRNAALFRLAERAGAADVVAGLLTGYR